MKKPTLNEELNRISSIMYEMDNFVLDTNKNKDEQAATPVEKIAPKPTPSVTNSSQKPEIKTTMSTASSGKPTPNDDQILNKKLADLGIKTIDVTSQIRNGGYGKNLTDANYQINVQNKDVYRSQNGVVTAIFKRKSGSTNENFSVGSFYLNPLLFESVVNEQQTVNPDYYECIGNCYNQKKMDNRFTITVDNALTGKKSETGQKSDPWAKFPCVIKTAQKITDPKMGVVYKDNTYFYYSNGRLKTIKGGAMGSFTCDGDKIVPNAGTKKTTYKVVTDADLMGETGLINNLIHSPAFGAFIGGVVGGLVTNFLDRKNRRSGVKGVVDAVDGWVDTEDLAYVLLVIKSLNNKFYFDEETGTYIPATKRFVELYSEDESGDNLISDINAVSTKTLPTGSEKVKSIIVKTINNQLAQPVPSDLSSQQPKQEEQPPV